MALADQDILAQNTAFQGRVRQALLAACVSVSNEGATVTRSNIAHQVARFDFATQVLNSPSTNMLLYANTVAGDANVISDATQGGTVPLNSGNIAAQQALVTDTHIANAIAGQFDSFFTWV